MRLKLTIEYAGTRYSGWQIQKNARTVQGELERAMREATGARTFETLRLRAGPTPASTRWPRSRTSTSTRRSPPETSARGGSTTPCRPTSTFSASSGCGTGFTRGTTPSRAATSIRSHAGARRSPSRSSGGSRTTLDVPSMRQTAGRFVGFHDFQSFSR